MYITYTEASEKFKVSKITILNWVKLGRLQSGPLIGKAKTVTRESANTLLEDSNFMQELSISQSKTSKLSKVDAHEIRLNSLEREVKELREFKEKIMGSLSNDHLQKLTLSNKEKAVTAKAKPKDNKPEKKRKSSPFSKCSGIYMSGICPKSCSLGSCMHSFRGDKREFIEECISLGIAKSSICIQGKGSHLSRWLDGKQTASEKKIEEWFKKACELREKKSK